MTTGNTAAMTFNQGSIAKGAQKDDCKELGQRNAARRKLINASSRRSKKIRRNRRQPNTTISSFKFQPAEAATATSASAHSSQIALRWFPAAFVEGGDKATVRAGKAPVMCSKDKKHTPDYIQNSGHAEARLLDTLGNQMGVKMVFKIDWRKGSLRSSLPCRKCQRLMCIAMAECKHEIWLCNRDNEPKKLTSKECTADAAGKVTDSARRSLEKLMR